MRRIGEVLNSFCKLKKKRIVKIKAVSLVLKEFENLFLENKRYQIIKFSNSFNYAGWPEMCNKI